MKPIFTGKISKGKFFMDNRKDFDGYVGSLGEGEYQLTIEKRRKARTTGKEWEQSNENGYYWAIVIPHLQRYFASIGLRMDTNQVHDGIKMLFLNEGMFSKFPKIGSTAKLSTDEWEALMSRIREWAAEEYHLYIPQPNEYPT
jgi:hypothetical protein